MLGNQLRVLRRERGMTLKDAAEVIRGSVSKVSRLERGESPPKERDVHDLLHFYKASPGQVQQITLQLQHMQNKEWWQQYRDVAPGFLKKLIGLEGCADKICTYENHVVPGILQTETYARVLVKGAMPHLSDVEIEKRVRLRKHRQVMLARPGPLVVALLDESVLRRPVGGPAVMCEQLEHLKGLDDVPNVNVRVVTFEKGAGVAPTYPITHLRFGDGGPPELVYVELIDSALYLTRATEIERYRHVLGELSLKAATREETMDLLTEMIRYYRSRHRL
ncbi:helix-turn-helix transcriptional regulator [Streptomyces netropsis]|uniref:helix-turn-helix domain-containing protein n=1 Tax=Streptomyces netropsis TaxID=55404 RepID=UPI0030D09B33